MIPVTILIVLILIVGVLYMTPYSPGKAAPRALQDELDYTIALIKKELSPHYDELGTPIDLTRHDTLEHELLGTLHVLAMTCARAHVLHPDLHLLIGPDPYGPGPTRIGGKIFNGERSLALVYRSTWRFDFSLDALFDVLFLSPKLEDFVRVHQDLALRSCLVTHDRIEVRIIFPEALLRHRFREELEMRQKRILAHYDALFAIMSGMTLHQDLKAPALMICHLFERADSLGLSWKDRAALLEVLLDSGDEAIIARTWIALIERAESPETTPQELERLAEWLIESPDAQIASRIWRLLFAIEDPLILLSRYGERAIAQFSEEELVTLVRRDHFTHTPELVALFDILLPHLPLSLLADETIDFEFKLRMTSVWLQMEHLKPPEIQQALRDMILAHPFERQRIQRHISTTIPNLQFGAISLSHGLPNGNISIVDADEEIA